MMNRPGVIWAVVALSVVLAVIATIRGAWVLAVFLYVCTALNVYGARTTSRRVRDEQDEQDNKPPTG